jgi:uncharacterized membrane protein
LEQVVSFLFKYRPTIFSKSQFGFGARPSVLLIVAALAAVALLVYFLYISSSVRLTGGWRAALVALRCALLAVILIILMRPVIVVPSVVPQSSYVAVLMDDSSSMRLTDQSGGSRLDAVKRLMTGGSQFYDQLAERFKVRAFKFSAAAERVADASELSGAGEQTRLQAAIEQAVRDSAGLPLAGVVVFSDGAGDGQGDFSSTLADLRARGLPVFTVGLGETSIKGDVEVVRATAPRRVLAGSPVTAELLLRASDLDQKSVEIELVEDNHLLRTQKIPVQGEATAVARITFTPTTPGIHRYTLNAKPGPDEPIIENNSAELLIEVEDGRPKVLYVEGEPRWEYGKLRQAMAEEKNLVLVSVLRSADGKYYRQGVESGDELASGFPKSEEEAFKYDAIVLGSIEATFFTFDQLRALEQFVSRRGGTLLALGGAKSFNSGGYANTPIADLLPVFLRGESATGEVGAFKAAPASRGQDHPAARLADDPEANLKAWEQMPGVTLPETLADTKAGATVILEARGEKDRSRAVPFLVEERYGRGRTLALLASDTWRWQMMLESKNQAYETFWRNLLRYLVGSVRRRVEASTERSYYGKGEPVRIRVEVGDEKYIHVSDARVVARVAGPTGTTTEVALAPVIEGGFEGYSGLFAPDEDGRYHVEVSARRGGDAKQAASLGDARTSFLVGPLNREARNAAQNEELLRRVAKESGGAYYRPEQAANLIEDLTHTEGAGSVRVTYDLWDMPVNFMMLVALAGAEWFIRKRKGLA